MVSLKTHNILDYIAAAALLVSPWLFGFSGVLAAKNLFVAAGFMLAIYSACTKYELSLFKVIPLKAHLAMDAVLGVFIAIGPFLWDYSLLLTRAQHAVHWIYGLGVLALVVATQQQPQLEAIEISETKKVA